MRNLKLKATLKTILSDWPDKPNQGGCQFLAVDLVLSKYWFVCFFNRKGTYLTERKREARIYRTSWPPLKAPSLFVTSFSLRKTVSKLLTAFARFM